MDLTPTWKLIIFYIASNFFFIAPKIRDNFKTVWKQWEEPVKTLEELQEALDLSDEYITIWVVKSVDENGILTYTEQKFEDLKPDTRINLWGVRFEFDEFSPATAIVRLLADGETGEEYLAHC